MQNLHTGPFDIYALLPFTFCIRANDVGNGVVLFQPLPLPPLAWSWILPARMVTKSALSISFSIGGISSKS